MPARNDRVPRRPSGAARRIALAAGLSLLGGSAMAAAPPNDSFANPIALTGTNISATGSNLGASKQAGEPNHAGDAGGRSVWWSWTAPFNGSVITHTSGSSFDTLLAIYTGTALSSLTLIAANDQDMFDPLGGDTSRAKFNALLGTTYLIAVDGYGGDSGNIALTITPPPRPPNDNFDQRLVLTGLTLTTNGINFEATREDGEPIHAGEPGDKSVWWSWTAPFAGPTTLSTVGSDFDTTLAVYGGDTVDDLSLIAANDQDPLGGSTSRVLFEARMGARYEIAVDGYYGESGIVVLNLTMPPTPPVMGPPRRLANGTFQATLFGAAGRTYVMEAKTNVTGNGWSPVATNVLGPTGIWNYLDASTPSFPHRFFRARLRE